MDEERDIQNDTASKLSKLADTQLGSSMAAGAVAAIVSRICTRMLLLQSTATLPVKIARMNLYHEPHVPCISNCQMHVSCHHILHPLVEKRTYIGFADPADTVKARLQMQGALNAAPVYHNTWHAFASLARAEGLPGFYRGFGAILLGFAPAQVQCKCSY